VRKQKTDRKDAQLLLQLLLEGDGFPRIWVPSPENRDLRQLLWHRHRLVQMRTRIMNQLQAVAMNEGLRRKRALWSESGRKQLESFLLAPWATRRRQDLLELLDRLNPTIQELTAAVEKAAQNKPEVQLLMSHPGVGPLTALAFVLIIGSAERFQCGKPMGSYLPIEQPTNEVIPRNNQQRHGDHETRDLTNHGEKRMPKGSAGERKLLRQSLSNAKRIYPDFQNNSQSYAI
jgi:transposase